MSANWRYKTDIHHEFQCARCLQNASNCTDFSLDFQHFPRELPPDPLEISSLFHISNSSLWLYMCVCVFMYILVISLCVCHSVYLCVHMYGHECVKEKNRVIIFFCKPLKLTAGYCGFRWRVCKNMEEFWERRHRYRDGDFFCCSHRHATTYKRWGSF